MVRLVKGAYWDTEVKRAQERGLADYPVFTRKAMTDLCYVACAAQLLAARPRLYPQFATHNALTVASVIEDAGGVEGYEFQRLHGMGEVLYERCATEHAAARRAASTRRSAAIAICWPIWCAGCWRTAPTRPSSSVAADPAVPVAAHPQAAAELDRRRRAARATRRFRCRATSTARAAQFARASNSAIARAWKRCSPRSGRQRRRPRKAAPLIDGVARAGDKRARSARRSTASAIGQVREATMPSRAAAMARRATGFARLERDAGRRARRRARTRRRSAGARRGALDRAAAARRRQDPRRCAWPKCARRSISAATMRSRRARTLVAAGAAGSDRRDERAALSRPRRVRLHQPVEFPARDLSRPGRARRWPPATQWSPSRPSRRR